MTALTYRYVALTDVGRRRTNNEDSGYASDHLLAIADGMGGAAAGELASSTALNTLRTLDRSVDIDGLTALQETVRAANRSISDLIAKNPSVEGMGTTLEAMFWDGEKLASAHLGDSRTYRLRDNELTQLSEDHTFVQSLVDEGRLTSEEARSHPHRSLLLRAMLGRDDNEADYTWIQPQLGDRYLLCSDGLTDMVDDVAIEQALRAETIDMAATDLVRLALEGGGFDNVTVVIAEFVEKDSDPDEHLSSSDGRPQLVGAASEQPRPPTGSDVSATTDATGIDEEELRYASRPPGRFRVLKVLAAITLVLAVLGGAGYFAYQWSQDQYYVGTDGERVVIYRGVDVDLLGLELSEVDQVTTVRLESLPSFTRRQVENGIAAEDRPDAREIVANLDGQSTDPTPTPSPTPTESPSEDDSP